MGGHGFGLLKNLFLLVFKKKKKTQKLVGIMKKKPFSNNVFN